MAASYGIERSMKASRTSSNASRRWKRHPTGRRASASFPTGEAWVSRIKGLRANASCLSHAELDEAEELDDGNPQELGQQYSDLRRLMGHITVLGGCCGTDHRHIEAISHACTTAEAA